MFAKGIFPDNCKVAKIIPVFKSGSKLDINNYTGQHTNFCQSYFNGVKVYQVR